MRTVEITYRYGDTGTSVRSRPPDADSARLRLNEGNRVFAGLFGPLPADGGTAHRIIEVDLSDLGVLAGEHGAPQQRPFAAVLGCSDARVPIELIFNEGPNDLFVVRVAGNGLGNDVLGSLRYAIEHLRGSLRLVVVLGHSGCGAMSAAVDSFLEPAGYLSLATDYALRGILDRQLIVIQATSRKLTSMFGGRVMENSRYREALIEASIVTNAALTAYTVQQELHGLDTHDLRAVYGVYLLQSREIWTPTGSADGATGLAEPPRDLASFIELGEAIAESDRIRSLITPQ
jgi:carbonic anhydrase